MKSKQNKNQKKQSGLPNRSDEQLSGNTTTPAPEQKPVTAPAPAEQAKPARILPYVNYAEREANRALPTDGVVELLRRFLPRAYDLAEVVGNWIWITFPEPPPEQVRGQLSQFGFHWNNTRKCWQHPCGYFQTERSGQDPREKYGTRFPADAKAA